MLVDVLAGDAGDALTLTGAGAPADGTAAISGGKILYTPTPGYIGVDTFTYTVTDAHGLTATAAVDVAVLAGGSSGGAPLTAEPLTASVAPGGTVTLDPVAADSGEGLTLTSIGAPAHGTAEIAGGLISYTAGPAYVGADSLTYTVTDVNGATASSTATIDVEAAGGNVQPTVFSPSLTVAEGAAPTAIGIAAPTDPVSAADALAVALTSLPTDGTVTSADGAAVAVGQTLDAAELQGLLFTPAPRAFGELSTLGYSVTDAAGNAASGEATLAIGPAAGAPAVSQPSLATTPYAGASPLGVAAPQDPNFAASLLTIAVRSLPTNGALTLADGTPLAGPGQVLTVAELQGLLFTPDQAAAGDTSAFSYGVTDPAGNAGVGTAIIAVGPRTAAAAPTIGFVSPLDGSLATLAITDAAAAPSFAGTSGKDVTVTLSGASGSAEAGTDGRWTIRAGALDPSASGERLSVSAAASWPGLAASTSASAAQLLVLPAPDAAGVVATDLSSLDVANLLHAGYSLRFSPGVEAVQLVDGVLSVGADTDEAFIQRLYVGLLGRSYDAAGMESWALAMAGGETEAQVAAGFLASAEYVAAPHAAGATGFVQSLYAGFLGRGADAAELAYWTGAPAQALGRAAIVSLFDESAESKARNADATSKVFARSESGTVIHDVYESALGREADVAGLAAWTSMAKDAAARRRGRRDRGLRRGAGRPRRADRRPVRDAAVRAGAGTRAECGRPRLLRGAAAVRLEPHRVHPGAGERPGGGRAPDVRRPQPAADPGPGRGRRPARGSGGVRAARRPVAGPDGAHVFAGRRAGGRVGGRLHGRLRVDRAGGGGARGGDGAGQRPDRAVRGAALLARHGCDASRPDGDRARCGDRGRRDARLAVLRRDARLAVVRHRGRVGRRLGRRRRAGGGGGRQRRPRPRLRGPGRVPGARRGGDGRRRVVRGPVGRRVRGPGHASSDRDHRRGGRLPRAVRRRGGGLDVARRGGSRDRRGAHDPRHGAGGRSGRGLCRRGRGRRRVPVRGDRRRPRPRHVRRRAPRRDRGRERPGARRRRRRRGGERPRRQLHRLRRVACAGDGHDRPRRDGGPRGRSRRRSRVAERAGRPTRPALAQAAAL